jgi:DnaK suppressor protein
MPAKKPASKSVKPSRPPAARAPAKPAVKAGAKHAAKVIAKKPVSNTAKPSVKQAASKPSASKSAATKSEAGSAGGAAAKSVAPTKPADSPSMTTGKEAATAPARESALKAPSANEKEVVATFVVRNPRPLAQPTDSAADGEDGEDHNLLSGPRNVQPYIVQRGEQYMSREQLEHFRTILQTWKRDLMREVDRTVSHMKDEAANFPDPNDRATQEEEFSLELRTRDRERKLIRKIEEALERIEDGSYGYCLETGEEIGIKRLEARPVATLSLEAQERRERREKQYGDRDDRYR